MSDAARLSAKSFATKPSGLSYTHHKPTTIEIAGIQSAIRQSVLDSSYAAVISYIEAISSIQSGSISWSIVKLYYSCFYCLRSLLLLNKVVPFNSGSEMVLDVAAEKFLKAEDPAIIGTGHLSTGLHPSAQNGSLQMTQKMRMRSYDGTGRM
ncbi:hypothetical protein K3553_15625 [Leisingera aquaemixtae]|uniref:hypothetical protein n=1 Tax=Leisingera aquaemixtae TaxID=1396826 RepID=UPI0021A5FB2F|nr:hypothetical protein [Leisingera aquaemixtae]UWQ24364.1 hypothetical protein K3553_15625 [Leisingera aquaemixtae]